MHHTARGLKLIVVSYLALGIAANLATLIVTLWTLERCSQEPCEEGYVGNQVALAASAALFVYPVLVVGVWRSTKLARDVAIRATSVGLRVTVVAMFLVALWAKGWRLGYLDVAPFLSDVPLTTIVYVGFDVALMIHAWWIGRTSALPRLAASALLLAFLIPLVQLAVSTLRNVPSVSAQVAGQALSLSATGLVLVLLWLTARGLARPKSLDVAPT